MAARAIRSSPCCYPSNVVIVRKKDRTIHICVDLRKLKSEAITDFYAVPRMEDSFHILAWDRYFSKLYLMPATNKQRLRRKWAVLDSMNLIVFSSDYEVCLLVSKG